MNKNNSVNLYKLADIHRIMARYRNMGVLPPKVSLMTIMTLQRICLIVEYP